MHWLRSRAAAEDVLQETTLRCYDALASYRVGTRFKSWLFKIAVNQARSYQRSESRAQRRHQAYQDSYVPFEGMRLTDQMEVLGTLERGLAQLSPDDRKLLLLRYAEELSLEELGALFEVPVFVIKMRVHRARQRFRCVVVGVEEAP
jgi:RNA polymerase sigma-70 factor (ECF subfamily)